ncbi:MAG: LytTR family DNA-binding domain-containing protein [Lacunisphaera sp.]
MTERSTCSRRATSCGSSPTATTCGLHATDKSRFVRMSLQKMMERLDPKHFVRIHRSTIVNLRHMKKAGPALYGEYSVELTNGTKLRVSRTFVHELKAHL